MKIISLFLVLSCCSLALAVQYCSVCAYGICQNNAACIDQGLSDAPGCISFWVDYGPRQNASYSACWDPTTGTCEQIIEAEKKEGFDAGCNICYEDNCNAPPASVY
ncbi:unnamed protein product [Ceutorhynchus assimilis]|uniref:Uncharacterized protein n=1 Tax=Ceutorhynchus assimilis TaxID=467358 RepID=A0A9N9QM38_9CUCU|nr:unnamed protein product [Ceutorhynchus assimilis]